MIQQKVKSRGTTLVELLVVLGIITLVAALVLPSVKNILIDRKGTQSAALVRNFLEAARARAIGNGRPVAVVFERLCAVPADIDFNGVIDYADTQTVGGVVRLVSGTAADPLPAGPTANTNFLPYNTCIRMSMAEEPLPFTDAMLATPIVISKGNYASAPGTLQGTQGGADLRYYFIPSGQLNATILSYFVAGNEISFGSSQVRYMIPQTAVDGSGNLWFVTLNPNFLDATADVSVPSTIPNDLTSYAQFKVFPKPRTINGISLQLPKGMCVDLSLSGFATAGSVSGLDRRRRFSSEWLYAGASVPEAAELRPVMVVFSSEGSMSRVYANGMGGNAANLVPDETSDDFFFHVGKIDQVVPPAMPAVATARQNLTDLSGYIVRLSPKSGAISCSPAANYVTQAALRGVTPGVVGDIVQLARQSTYGVPATAQ